MKYLMHLALLAAVVACAKPNYADAGRSRYNKTQGSICTLKFTKAEMCMAWNWVKAPTDEAAGVLEMYFSSPLSAGEAATPADPNYTPFVMLWMPGMGHGSSPVSVERIAPGVYRGSNVFFSMPGDWEIRFQLRDGKKVMDEVIEPIKI